MVKILKEVRLSQNSSIRLESQFVWNNGGQKHSLIIDVKCPVSGQFFPFCAEYIDELAACIIRARFISYL